MIVVAGEALVDVFTDAAGVSTETAGGSPLNVAVGLGRLDVGATLLTQLADDERGAALVRHVGESGAAIVAAPTGSGRTSVAHAHLDETGAARYDFDIDWSLPRQQLPPCRGLHVGSLGTVLEPGAGSVLDLVSQAVDRGLLVSYDLNVRESFVPDAPAAWRAARDLAHRCGLVKLSDEDATVLAPHQPPEETAAELLDQHPDRLVLLTRGAAGATAYTAAGTVSVTPRATEVVDTVGAGDAFMAGTLARLHDIGCYDARTRLADLTPEDLELLLAGAVEVAAITCERRGANPPTRAELPEGWPAPSH